MNNDEQARFEAEALARQFHDTYERLAPAHGYETRKDTKTFDPEAANGKLMIAVCQQILAAHQPQGEPVAYARRDTLEQWKGQSITINTAWMFPSPKGLSDPVALYPASAWPKSSRLAEADAEIERLKEAADAYASINTPEIRNFIVAIEREALHQRERWGSEHDAGKRREDWITLLTYLIGKAAKSHFDGDQDKILHHIITTAAACLNWHAMETGDSISMRPGLTAPETAIAAHREKS